MNVSKKIRVIAALGTLSGAVWAGTFATFTGQDTSTTTFTAGTVVISSTEDAFTTVTVDNLKPGDIKYAPLTVSNTGTLAFSYGMATTDDGDALADQLTLGIRKVANAAACDSGGVGFLAATDIADAGGALSGAATLTARSLAAGASEVLCFRVELPSTTGDTFQGSSTLATFTFDATQS